LYLYADTEEVILNLRMRAREHGVDPSRIYFGARLDQAEYLSRYTLADLFLDTFPYNAGTTASDALWSGLPVLTRQGKSFASRMASSLLTALGMTELITFSEEDYFKAAVEIGREPQRTAQIKQKLAQQRTHSELFNTPAFTRRIESLYKEMFNRYDQGLKPTHIEL
jgi:predicted O-linked N-acetylglucosamine transferase (SPINDLY family)